MKKRYPGRTAKYGIAIADKSWLMQMSSAHTQIDDITSAHMLNENKMAIYMYMKILSHIVEVIY